MDESDPPSDRLDDRWPSEWGGAAPEDAPETALPAAQDPPPDDVFDDLPPVRPEALPGEERPVAGLRGRAGVLVPALVLALAIATRLWGLGTPGDVIPLDETHYVTDAREILDHGTEEDFVVHPPVGKWFIAAGMAVFGRGSAFGWRFSGAVLGALGVLVIYLIGLRLWGSRRTAVLAALLLGIEGLWFVQSRVAMLDIYTAFFALLAFWLVLEDRARAGPDHRGPRWWRLGAGAAFGLAVASKWAAVWIAPLLILTAAAAEVGRLRGREGFRRALGGQGLRLAGTFGLLPVALYAATYLPWFVSSDRYVPPACEGKALPSAWVCYQREMFRFHQHLEEFDDDGKVKHPYFSEPWSWAYIGRPVAHFYRTDGEGDAQRDREIIGLPNPAVWWGGFLAIAPLSVWALRRRDATASTILLGIAMLYLPYLVFGAAGRANFLFYATPLAPFLVLAVAHVLHRASRFAGANALVIGYVLIAIMLFAYFYPVLAGVEIPHDGPFGWRARIWFSQDCTAEGVKYLCWI